MDKEEEKDGRITNRSDSDGTHEKTEKKSVQVRKKSRKCPHKYTFARVLVFIIFLLIFLLLFFIFFLLLQFSISADSVHSGLPLPAVVAPQFGMKLHGLFPWNASEV